MPMVEANGKPIVSGSIYKFIDSAPGPRAYPPTINSLHKVSQLTRTALTELLCIHNHKFSFEVANNGHHHHWTNSPEPKYDARVSERT